MSARRVRVCIVCPYQYGGGAEFQIGLLNDALVARGDCDVYYVARVLDARAARPGVANLKVGRGTHKPRLGFISDALPLHRTLAALAPDVVYERVACGYTGICAWYAQHAGVRSAWHVAHDADVERDGRMFGRNPVRRWLESSSVAYGARHATHVITQTRHQAERLQANFGRPATVVIPNFHPAPDAPPAKGEPLTIAWVANFKRWKRPEVFLRLAAALRDLPHVRFVMAGEQASGAGDEQWGRELLETARAAGNVEYLGHLSFDAANALLERAHVLVNTSVAEGFSNTYIQAWMREVPVVSLDVDPDGVLERERIGMHAGSEERLAQAVRQLAMDGALRADYGTRARTYALARHSLRNATELGELLITGRVAGGR